MRLRIWVLFFAVLAMSACTGVGNTPETPATDPLVVPAYEPQSGLSDKARFREALVLLERGEPLSARVELELYLVSQPASKVARDLIRQIDLPSHEYFPSDYREITLPSGVSLSSLSKRYLGSVFKFHALAKYNGILRPGDMTAGQDIRMPLTAAAIAAFAEDDAVVEPSAAGKPASGSLSSQQAAPGKSVPQEEEAASEIESEAAQEVKNVVVAPSSAEPVLSGAEIEQLHRTALGAYRAQNLDKAISLWDEVLAADSGHESARLYRSQAIELKRKLRKLN